MEDEIKVGEYVRSNLGSIGKVTKIEDGKFLYENKCLICFISNVVQHSKNLIDLIQEGDIVNGTRIKMNYEAGKLVIPKKIKSILTHEQFESMKYIIKEDKQ